MSRISAARIYVGNLPQDVREREVEDLFYKYGRIRDIALKGGRGGAPFCFIEFDDPRDADDAIFGRDGYDFAGGRLRVERPRGDRFSGGGGGGGGGGFGGGGGGRDSRDFGRSMGGGGEHRVIVSGIPKSGSWQDLKDFCRDGGLGNVLRTDVTNGEGIVELGSADDVDRAIKNLDDTKFRSHMDESAYVRVRRDGDSGGGGGRRSRSRSRSRSKSPDDDRRRRRSPSAGSDRSRGSRSPPRRGSRSPPRRGSRSPSPKRDSRSPPRAASRSKSPRD